MRKYFPLILAAAVSGLASTALASFSVVVTDVPLSATLSNAGWAGFLITIKPDNGWVISAVDATKAIPSRGILLPGGIYGPVLQRWTLDTSALDGSIQRVPTPRVALTAPTGLAGRTDSYWLNEGYFEAVVDGPSENNDGLNATTGLQDRPAVADVDNGIFIDGADFGIGTCLTVTEATHHSTADPMNLAFVIAQPGVSEVVFRATVIDSTNRFTAFNVQLTTPEPASIGVLAMGTVALLARRRQRVAAVRL